MKTIALIVGIETWEKDEQIFFAGGKLYQGSGPLQVELQPRSVTIDEATDILGLGEEYTMPNGKLYLWEDPNDDCGLKILFVEV